MLPALALGVMAASAARSWWSGHQQADEQRRVTDEQLRRMRLDQERVLGTARARGAASGIEYESGSLQTLLAGMESEFARQRAWAKRAGYQNAAMTNQAAGFNFIADLGQSLTQYGQANNWWRTSPLGAVGGTGRSPITPYD
jgi:hypothetical protein